MIELFTTNLHFLGDDENAQRHDLCIHGNVFFKLHDEVIAYEEDRCVSASALQFLRSLYELQDRTLQMIPCCGHFMIPSQDGTTVTIHGCSNGLNFDVRHQNGEILIRTEDCREYRISYPAYRSAVLTFANQIRQFYQKSPSRIPEDEFEKDGFAAFQTEFYTLYHKATEQNQF